MKILQLVPYFLPYNGGQEQYVYNLSKHLVKMGHTVHIITSNFPKTKKYEIIEGITVERHDYLFRPLRNPITPTFLNLKKVINRFDVVHTHNEHSFAAMMAAYFKRKVDLPLVLTCHGQLKSGNPYTDAIEMVYSKSIGKLVFHLSDLIITLSESDKEYISSFGVDLTKIHVIPNAIDPALLPDLNSEKIDLDSFYRNYTLNGKKIVLFVGPIIKRKGIEYFLKAIPLILDKIDASNLIFVCTGTGDYLEEAKKLAKNLNIDKKVVFTGYIKSNDLSILYQISELLSLPSFSEGLPTSILEAMYYGLPVIASDIPGIRDYFKNNAILVPIKDEYSLARAINGLLNDDSLNKTLSFQGKIFIKNHYTWDIVAKRYENLYKNCIKEGVLNL